MTALEVLQRKCSPAIRHLGSQAMRYMAIPIPNSFIKIRFGTRRDNYFIRFNNGVVKFDFDGNLRELIQYINEEILPCFVMVSELTNDSIPSNENYTPTTLVGVGGARVMVNGQEIELSTMASGNEIVGQARDLSSDPCRFIDGDLVDLSDLLRVDDE